MGTRYQHLSAEERATIMIMLQQGCSARSIARTLQRSPSTITREIRRALDWPQRAAFVPAGSSTYDARAAGARAHV
ncbi:helix-turn-helix domain-containing protein, partial [Enterobacter hormaechei]